MKTVLCKEFGPPETLVVEDIASTEPGPGQVVLDVHAAAVNFPDTLIIENKYQFKPPLPFSPGGEVAGVVSKLGEGASMYKIGDRVIGSCGHGGFVEQLAIPETSCIPVPDAMDLETASALVLTYGTSYYALKDRAYVKPGENLLVMGAAGGVGLAGGQPAVGQCSDGARAAADEGHRLGGREQRRWRRAGSLELLEILAVLDAVVVGLLAEPHDAHEPDGARRELLHEAVVERRESHHLRGERWIGRLVNGLERGCL